MLTKIKTNQQNRRHINEFANANDLINFGAINKTDEIDRYRGVTFSRESRDYNFHQGSINDYDISVFSRETTIPIHKGKDQIINSTILAVHLKVNDFPHLFLDNRQFNNKIYQSLSLSHPELRVGNRVMEQLNPSFDQFFDLYIAPSDVVLAINLMDDTILQKMINSFSKFDIELLSNRLLIINNSNLYSSMQLQSMLDESLWLAETFELKRTYSF